MTNPCRVVVVIILAASGVARAEDAPSPAAEPRPYETIVTATTPLNGSGLPVDRVPANVQTATGAGLSKAQSLDLSAYMDGELGSVHAGQSQGNPLQPELEYRGYLASPLLGAPQGLSVYWGGVRLNEVFGDTVNWDLIPTSAIRTLNLMPGSNPLFGMNTLGGALSIETKTGFSDPGAEVRVSGGSFDRRLVGLQMGAHGERLAYYVAADLFKEDGWRSFSPSEAARAMLSTTWQGDAGNAELTLATAETELDGNGATPVQLLAQDWRATYTHPDRTQNRLLLAALRAERALAPAVRLSGVAFVRRNRTQTLNGDQADRAPCQDPALAGSLCTTEAGKEVVVTDAGTGAPVAFDPVHPYDGAENGTQTTQVGTGVAAQVAVERPLASRENHLFVGASGGEGHAHFTSQSALARLSDARGTLPTDIVVGGSPVDVVTVSRDLGLYAADTFAVLPDLFLTLSARYNLVSLTLEDQLGDALSGAHRFQRLNPAGGASYQPRPEVGVFGGYSEATRAPTALELTCASETAPCRLPNSIVSDPELRQVVARTLEAGVRGHIDRAATNLSYSLAAFRTTNDDDILFVGSGVVANQGYFANVGRTRRQGLEAGLQGRRRLGPRAGRLDWSVRYTWLDATFQTGFEVPSPNHPAAAPDASCPAGGVCLRVPVGARLPNTPRHIGKATVTWTSSHGVSLGGNVVANTGQVRRGDEANLLDVVPGFVVLELRSGWDVTPLVSLFAKVSNVLDTRYSTYGVLGNARGVLGAAYDNPRFNGPGAPRTAWAGLTLRY
jgi:iron complex outermembrane receptor protein